MLKNIGKLALFFLTIYLMGCGQSGRLYLPNTAPGSTHAKAAKQDDDHHIL